MLACARDEDDSRRFDLAQARTLRPFATVDINKSHHHYAPPTNNFRRDALLKVNISVQAHTNKEIPWINGPRIPLGQGDHILPPSNSCKSMTVTYVQTDTQLRGPRHYLHLGSSDAGAVCRYMDASPTAPIEQVCQQPCHAACCMLVLRRNWTLHTPYR